MNEDVVMGVDARCVPGYRDRAVTSEGVVYSTKSGRPLSVSLSNAGYPQVAAGDNTYGPRTNAVPVHRLVALAWLPNDAGYAEIDHIDNDKTNNNVANLRWVSKKANMARIGRTGKAFWAVKVSFRGAKFPSATALAEYLGCPAVTVLMAVKTHGVDLEGWEPRCLVEPKPTLEQFL